MSNQPQVFVVQEEHLTVKVGVAVKGDRGALEEQILESSICHSGIRVPQLRLEQSLVSLVLVLIANDYSRLVVTNRYIVVHFCHSGDGEDTTLIGES